jgi:hypothetical protein
MRRLSLGLLLATALVAPSAHAAGVTLLAHGTLTGSSAGADRDLSGLTGKLENGVRGDLLGGLGSGIAYAGGSTFLAVPDRGPNAVPFNSLIDDTASYINRIQTINMDLTASAPGSALPFNLTPTLTHTTLLYSGDPLNYGSGAGLGVGSGAPARNTASKFYFTGRSDNFNPATNSGDASDARFDPESIRVSPDGKTVYISDEYGPYIRQFDRKTGELEKTFTLPANLDVAHKSSQGAVEINAAQDPAGNLSGRTANKGMEGLSITPDGKTLVGMMQAGLIQDVNDALAVDAKGKKIGKSLLRIVTVDVATGATHEYGYKLTDGSGVSDIVALNDHQFLVDERDGSGLGNGDSAVVKKLYVIDISGATDITGMAAHDALKHLVTKSSTPFLDIVSALGTSPLGITPDQVPAKIEGIAFGQDVTYNGSTYHTLWVSNDNDFVPGVAGPNQFFVFGFQDSDLGAGMTLARENIAAIPEPSSWALTILGLGGLGAAMRMRRRADTAKPQGC